MPCNKLTSFLPGFRDRLSIKSCQKGEIVFAYGKLSALMLASNEVGCTGDHPATAKSIALELGTPSSRMNGPSEDPADAVAIVQQAVYLYST
jgi:hypothetical protein